MLAVRLCLLPVAALAMREADEVLSLPGWTAALPSRMYSGFLPSTDDAAFGQMHLHYWLVESERNPEQDPVVVWFNGGPGASPLFGLLTELGPLLFSDLSKTAAYNRTGIPTPIRNAYSWSKTASILCISGPPPVGFSYCERGGVSGSGTSCGSWNDTRTAAANYAALQSWASAFPALAKNDLYVAGESYAGLYVTTLVDRILDHPGDLRLQGFLMGDASLGLLDKAHSDPAWRLAFTLEFFHGHAQISDKLHAAVRSACHVSLSGGAAHQRDASDGSTVLHVGEQCAAMVAKMYDALGGYYSYNLYDECGAENVIAAAAVPSLQVDHVARTLRLSSPTKRSQHPSVGTSVTGALNDYPCGGGGMMLKYLARDEVKDALHVPRDAFFFQCDNGEGFNYTCDTQTVIPIYHRALQAGLRVLVYDGDVDPGLNAFYAQNWTSSLGLATLEVSPNHLPLSPHTTRVHAYDCLPSWPTTLPRSGGRGPSMASSAWAAT